jgi:hypothetical protein
MLVIAMLVIAMLVIAMLVIAMLVTFSTSFSTSRRVYRVWYKW